MHWWVRAYRNAELLMIWSSNCMLCLHGIISCALDVQNLTSIRAKRGVGWIVGKVCLGTLQSMTDIFRTPSRWKRMVYLLHVVAYYQIGYLSYIQVLLDCNRVYLYDTARNSAARCSFSLLLGYPLILCRPSSRLTLAFSVIKTQRIDCYYLGELWGANMEGRWVRKHTDPLGYQGRVQSLTTLKEETCARSDWLAESHRDKGRLFETMQWHLEWLIIFALFICLSIMAATFFMRYLLYPFIFACVVFLNLHWCGVAVYHHVLKYIRLER